TLRCVSRKRAITSWKRSITWAAPSGTWLVSGEWGAVSGGAGGFPLFTTDNSPLTKPAAGAGVGSGWLIFARGVTGLGITPGVSGRATGFIPVGLSGRRGKTAGSVLQTVGTISRGQRWAPPPRAPPVS